MSDNPAPSPEAMHVVAQLTEAYRRAAAAWDLPDVAIEPSLYLESLAPLSEEMSIKEFAERQIGFGVRFVQGPGDPTKAQ